MKRKGKQMTEEKDQLENRSERIENKKRIKIRIACEVFSTIFFLSTMIFFLYNVLPISDNVIAYTNVLMFFIPYEIVYLILYFKTVKFMKIQIIGISSCILAGFIILYIFYLLIIIPLFLLFYYLRIFREDDTQKETKKREK